MLFLFKSPFKSLFSACSDLTRFLSESNVYISIFTFNTSDVFRTSHVNPKKFKYMLIKLYPSFHGNIQSI